MRRPKTRRRRADGWDSSRAGDYRVRYRDQAGVDHEYGGGGQRDPKDEDGFTIAHQSCVMPTAHGLERGTGEAELPVAERLGRSTPRNSHFPHIDLITHVAGHEPDLRM